MKPAAALPPNTGIPAVLAGYVTVYTAVDMMTYNTKRKAEFIEAQKKMETDSLDAARLAYMTGKATQEQIELVEEAIEREQAAGQSAGSSIFTKMPTVISKPNQTAAATQKVTEAASWPSKTEPTESTEDEKKTGLWA